MSNGKFRDETSEYGSSSGKVCDTFCDLYGDYPDQFKEEDGRRFFLLYLKPIINGTGNSAHGISGTLSFKERIYAELQF